MTNHYINMPLVEAQHAKHKAGVATHRNQDYIFNGNPLEELFEECLDGLNYSNECWNQNLISRETRQRWADIFRDTALEVQALWVRRQKASDHLGTVCE